MKVSTMNVVTDGTIKGLCDHVSSLLYGAKVEHRFVKVKPCDHIDNEPKLVLVLHGLDIDMNGELFKEGDDDET